MGGDSVVPQRPDQRALLPGVRTPVLGGGGRRGFHPSAVAEPLEMADAIPGAATAVLDKLLSSGRTGESARLVNALIKDFVIDA